MMKGFEIALRTDIRFGRGKIQELGEIVKRYGDKIMLVSCQWPQVQAESFSNIIRSIEAFGVKVILYDRSTPNPTVACIEEAAEIARREQVAAVVGLGGGSAMDTAKGVSLLYGHKGGIWDYTYVAQQPLPVYEERLLPVIAVTTTSGTGSQVTPYCVLQDPGRKVKTCVVANIAMTPKIAIVDPQLMETMPPFITATTGFDTFAHAFEAYVNEGSNPLIEILALKAMEIAVHNLERACKDGKDKEARCMMAWADTLGGLCITMNNTTMPHDIGQAIVGKSPGIAHGLSVAMVFPEYIPYAVHGNEDKFIKIAQIFDLHMEQQSCETLAEQLKDKIIQWEKTLGIFASGQDLGLSQSVKEAVVEETWQSCSFITDVCKQDRNQIAELIDRIWTQQK